MNPFRLREKTSYLELYILFYVLFKVCPTLSDPSNGDVTLTNDNLTVDQNAMYNCNHGYILIGEDRRICQVNATWSGSEPICEQISMF